MRPISRSSSWLGAIVTAIALAGCGVEAGDSADAVGSSASSSPAATDEPTHEYEDHGKHDKPTVASPTSETERPDEDAVEVEIEIEGGAVSPAGEQVDASVGDAVVLQVDSDAADELHVHTAPAEHEYAVRAADDQEFRFTVEQPGQFDIELHEAGVLVAQLVVRP